MGGTSGFCPSLDTLPHTTNPPAEQAPGGSFCGRLGADDARGVQASGTAPLGSPVPASGGEGCVTVSGQREDCRFGVCQVESDRGR
ncbi:hypothetical protein GCM10027590_68850 [Nocardiopsis nanhaiensis]